MISTIRKSTLFLALAAALAGFGCGGEEQPSAPPVHQFNLEVSVTDTKENPVPKAPVLVDGKPVGYTDRDGYFQAVISERAGAQVELAIGEFDGYLVPEDAVEQATLKLSKDLEGNLQAVPVELNTVVKSARQDYLVWVDANCGKYLDNAKCQNLPVLFNGEEIARTDDEGKAHFDFTGVPSDKVVVSFATPTYEPSADDDEDDAFVMKPESPSYEIELGLESEVLRITENFEDPVAAEKAKKKAKRRRRYRRRRRTTRKKTTTKKKKKQEKKSDIIELW